MKLFKWLFCINTMKYIIEMKHAEMQRLENEKTHHHRRKSMKAVSAEATQWQK